MSEEQEPSYIKLRKLLSTSVSDEKVVCPVSPTLLLEFKKRPASERLTKYCQLMDEFSEGLSIRNWLSIFKDEFKAITEKQQIEIKIAYSHFIDAFSVDTRVSFGENWTLADSERTGDLIFDYLVRMSISQVVNINIDEKQIGSVAFLRTRLSKLAEQERTWKENHHDVRQVIEHAEFTATVNAVLPQVISVFRSVAGITSTSFKRLTTTSITEKKEMLNQCPTFWCHYQLMTALRSNRATLKENDLWDLEHMASALPYVTCITCDGGTRHLCSDVLKLDKKYGTIIISKADDLIGWLESI